MNETKIYSTNDFERANIIDTIKEVSTILNEKGYNSVNQLVGYLISEDPGYITNFKDARKKLTKFDRTKILEVLISEFTK